MNIAGKRFGRLIAVSFSHRAKDHHSRWRFKCDCGQECIARPGYAKSCGCLPKDRMREICKTKPSLTHGLSKSNEYRIWIGMLTRCMNKNYHAYPYYGGRGIG